MEIRKQGALIFIVAGLAAIPLVWVLMVALSDDFPKYIGKFAVPLVALPVVVQLGGFIEMITGRSREETAQVWDNQKGWQRGDFGLFLVVVVLALFALVAVVLMQP